ncbi:MAG: DUF4214 domain-containing protein [Microcoleaceae cyanobacterium]
MIRDNLSKLVISESEVKEFITDLYRIILKRKPDAKGLEDKFNKLTSSKITLGKIVEAFIESPEGQARIFNRVWNKRTTTYQMDITTDVDIVQQLFSKTAQYWRNAGSNVDEVYFSVLASPSMKKELAGEQLEEFYSTGEEFIEFCVDNLNREGVKNLNELSCIDFGCGVGRLSFCASKYFKNVFAVDFSKDHLKRLEENMVRLPSLHKDNITSIYLESLSDLEQKLPQNMGFVYSYISLQHNTPPVIVFLLKQLLNSLQNGGYALLHIPIHHPFYSFSDQDYLASKNSGKTMEMHIVPRENIRDICESLKVKIIDSFGYGGTKGVYSEVFFFKKES